MIESSSESKLCTFFSAVEEYPSFDHEDTEKPLHLNQCEFQIVTRSPSIGFYDSDGTDATSSGDVSIFVNKRRPNIDDNYELGNYNACVPENPDSPNNKNVNVESEQKSTPTYCNPFTISKAIKISKSLSFDLLSAGKVLATSKFDAPVFLNPLGGVVPEVLSAQSNLVSGSSAEGDPVLVNERIDPADVYEVSISNEQKIDQLLGELLDSSKEPKLKKIYEELRPDERNSLFSRFFDGIKNMYFQTLNNYWSSIEFFIMNGHVFDDAKIQTAIAIDMITFEEEEPAMGKFFESHNKIDYSTLFLTVFFANRWHKLDFLFNTRIKTIHTTFFKVPLIE
ncbi:hypothetical protein O9G_004763 [Rozella allomycis CSF55]|uniref:Uncharacterized protein n=1 Tax=Rozella allomycis (strain CSF55) TaxID=988480 RepID=A0A075AN56_ROZAC|nr:hypothetical protein O9G_004763 [Rozella allomycis CSF55]|eukprot:EPZ31202.1 hypothetical protein O9G_004763 [Rozella allomycis CSF55]